MSILSQICVKSTGVTLHIEREQFILPKPKLTKEVETINSLTPKATEGRETNVYGNVEIDV